jgi:hypothetical protein
LARRPSPATRLRSGYTDPTRWLLNVILAHKADQGLGPRDPFPAATSGDSSAVIAALEATAAELAAGTDRAAAAHIRENVIPLAATYIAALGQAGYPAGLLFSRDFTIDTGQIVNQGRARALFRGLVSVDDEPMTPREERGYGRVSLSSARGAVWRIAPAPYAPGALPSSAATGGKNTPMAGPCLTAEELDPRHLRPVTRATGQPLRRYVISGADLEHVTLSEARRLHAYPGLTTR